MAEINARLVKQLRDLTGAGMGECKKALIETNGDLQAAADLLRARAVVKDSQASRDAGEGAVTLKPSADGKAVAVVQLCCETDFAARNENFQKLLGTIADVVLAEKVGSLADAQAKAPIAEGLKEAAAITIRENIQLKQAEYRALEGDGRVGTYVHHNGRVGVAVAVNAPAAVAAKPALEELLKDLAMHATAHVPNPVAVDKASIPQDLVDREKQIALRAIDENPKDKEKPQNIKEKMIEGKLRKFFEERALLEQKWVKDPNLSIGELVAKRSKELGGDIKVAWFVRAEVGSH